MIEIRPRMALAASLQEMIDEFGALRVFVAALSALLRPRLSSRLPELDERMRRDMGLPPKAASPPELPLPLRHPW